MYHFYVVSMTYQFSWACYIASTCAGLCTNILEFTRILKLGSQLYLFIDYIWSMIYFTDSGWVASDIYSIVERIDLCFTFTEHEAGRWNNSLNHGSNMMIGWNSGGKWLVTIVTYRVSSSRRVLVTFAGLKFTIYRLWRLGALTKCVNFEKTRQQRTC